MPVNETKSHVKFEMEVLERFEDLYGGIMHKTKQFNSFDAVWINNGKLHYIEVRGRDCLSTQWPDGIFFSMEKMGKIRSEADFASAKAFILFSFADKVMLYNIPENVEEGELDWTWDGNQTRKQSGDVELCALVPVSDMIHIPIEPPVLDKDDKSEDEIQAMIGKGGERCL